MGQPLCQLRYESVGITPSRTVREYLDSKMTVKEGLRDPIFDDVRLHSHHLGVAARILQELLMSAPFENSPALNYEDLIGPAHG